MLFFLLSSAICDCDPPSLDGDRYIVSQIRLPDLKRKKYVSITEFVGPFNWTGSLRNPYADWHGSAYKSHVIDKFLTAESRHCLEDPLPKDPKTQLLSLCKPWKYPKGTLGKGTLEICLSST